MSEKQWTDDERSEAFERGLKTMEGVALELYRRGREPLLEELEKVKRERDEWRDKFLALNQTAGELCNACGWAFRIPGESCRCEVVKERDEARATIAQIRRVFGNALAFDDARGDVVKMAEIAYRGACDGDKAVGQLRDMTRQRDEAREEAASSLGMAKIADVKHGWKCAEVDMLRGVGCNENGDGPCGACRKCAYRRGAEAMREACAEACRPILRSMASRAELAKTIRALPIPEET